MYVEKCKDVDRDRDVTVKKADPFVTDAKILKVKHTESKSSQCHLLLPNFSLALQAPSP